ncbi:YbbR-like protein [Caloramator mitchellensis]|uniref:YbbR-like protein n=1 Tax=Caloramator mitchellensis TaxID=908809 RepID=A0A0R3JUE3_CALMK|nr:CdaR family protein [Caloramator mitchellensis]KRQ87177.1 YbbR-like protein [Caloramator mitchellensis]
MVRKNKQEIIYMILSVFIALILWVYVMGEQNPTQARLIEGIPVYFINLDALEQNNLTILPNQKFTVNLQISGRAMDVYKVKAEDFRVEADMSGFLKKGYNNIPVEVKTVPKGVKVVYDKGNPYIRVKVDGLIEKTVPVNSIIAGNLKEGYAYSMPVLKPNEILIRGPETYVFKASNALVNIDVTNRDNDLSASLPIKIVDSYGDNVQYINYEPKYVDVSLPIKKSKDVDVIIRTKGELPDSKILNYISSKTPKITILGDESLIDRINSIETEPIDLSKIYTSIFKEVPLIIPEGIYTKENKKSITVDISVENKIEKNLTVDLILENGKDEFNYSLSKNSVILTIYGAESVVNSINSNDISAIIDVAEKEEGEITLPIKINLPRDIKLKKISQETVLVKITKK